jgi:DNA invertase Pin-like site-specific DNA recombinase
LGSPRREGQALFTILAAVAQLERNIIRERITAGVANARAKGRTLGWPMRIVDREKIAKMRAEGMSLQAIADKLGIGYGTVRKRLESLKSVVIS